jgi:hypothetical protein
MTRADDFNAEKVQARMRELRANADRDVERLVAAAQRVTDWRRYVRFVPWLCVGGAVAIGFWLVPRRKAVSRPHVDDLEEQDLEELARRKGLVLTTDQPAKKTASITSDLLKVVASVAVKASLAALERRMAAARDQARSPSPGPAPQANKDSTGKNSD